MERYLELELFLGGYGGLGAVAGVLVAALRDEVDRGGEAVDGQLVAVAQLVVALGQRAWGGKAARTPGFRNNNDNIINSVEQPEGLS